MPSIHPTCSPSLLIHSFMQTHSHMVDICTCAYSNNVFIQHTLCNAAAQQQYFLLPPTEIWMGLLPEFTIHWLTLCQPLNHFKVSNHCTITKFLHECLPLQDQHHVQSALFEYLCPSWCQAANKLAISLPVSTLCTNKSGKNFTMHYTSTKYIILLVLCFKICLPMVCTRGNKHTLSWISATTSIHYNVPKNV